LNFLPPGPPLQASNLSQLLGDLSIATLASRVDEPPPSRRSPASPGGGDEDDDYDDDDDDGRSPDRGHKSTARKEDRREKNREAARNSRLKKKLYISVLEDQVKHAFREAVDLRAQHQRTSDASNRTQMLAMIGSGAFRTALDYFGPGAPGKLRLADYRFENLSRNAAPAHLRILAWTINERNLDHEQWDRYVSKLKLSDEHRQRFEQMIQTKAAVADEVASERVRIERVASALALARQKYVDCATALQKRQVRAMQILSPAQQLALYGAVERRRAELQTAMRAQARE